MADINEMMRGNVETLILKLVSGGDKYGYEIAKIIAKSSDNRYELKEASMYTAFKRLEDAGNVISYWGDSHGGGCRKYYKITDKGKAELKKNEDAWKVARELIDNVLNGNY